MKIRTCKKREAGEQTQSKAVNSYSMFPNKISVAEFEEEVLQSPLSVLVVFYTTWCPPCKAIALKVRLFYEVHESKMKVCSVNADDETSLVKEYGIRAVPTFIIFHEGKIIDSFASADEEFFKQEMKKIFKKLKII